MLIKPGKADSNRKMCHYFNNLKCFFPLKRNSFHLKRLLFSLFFLLSAFFSFGQEYNYFHYNLKDGISGINIYSIVQDKDGFLWIGTETGLSRFDGSHFRNYTAADGLYDQAIIKLFVDSKNRVWIFPFNKTVYYYYQGKIHNAENDSLLRKFNFQNETFTACEDKDENLFFIGSTRLFILSRDGHVQEVNAIDDNDKFTDGGINANGYCTILTTSYRGLNNKYIFSYEFKNSKFHFINRINANYSTRNSLEINPYYTINKNNDSFHILVEKNKEQYVLKAREDFLNVSFLNSEFFAMTTASKTLLFDVGEGMFVDSFLNNITVNTCFIDNESNLWFGTVSDGLYRLNSNRTIKYKLMDNLNELYVQSLNYSGGILYIGSSENMTWQLNLLTNTLKKQQIEYGFNGVSKISSIQFSKSKSLILGTDNGVYQEDHNIFKKVTPISVIKSLYKYGDSMVAATDRNAFCFSADSVSSYDVIWHGRATCAVKNNGKFYIGTLAGLYTVDQNKKSFSLAEKYNFFKNKVNALTVEGTNDLWVALESYGLVCLQNDSVKYIVQVKDGLSSNMCRCLFIDKNILWVGSDKGISRIDVSHYPFRITNFTTADGLDCDIINCIYARGDSVFAGTPFGLTFFEADKIESKSICALKLTDIKSEVQDWYDSTGKIKLKSNDNLLRFEYAGISFLSAGDITYYYQLSGLDTAWLSTRENSITFDRLPYGSYVFKIYAVNRYGVKSKIISIPFTKDPHFWQMWWVRLLGLFAFGFLVWMVINSSIRKVKNAANKKMLHERKIHELEQMAFRAQMNPHFIFNSLNSVQQYIFSGNVAEANEFITNFSSLIRQTLYISGKKFVTIDEEIKYLGSYLSIEQSKYENIFDFVIDKDGGDEIDEIQIPPLLLQPYIENSIRHGVLNLVGKRGLIEISFSLKNDQLYCVVKDNGIGREASSALRQKLAPGHKSKGLELAQNRIKSLNSIYNIFISVSIDDINNDDEKGTIVTIKFPLNYGE